MKLRIESSSIVGNIVAFSPIMDIGGSVTVVNSLFRDNIGETGALLSLAQSDVSLSSSCFLGNGGNKTVSLSEAAVLSRNDETFGIGNADTECNGIDHGGFSCTSFSARFCSSSIELPFDIFAQYGSCISDYTALSDTLVLGMALTVELCPDTIINMVGRSVLRILFDNTTIKCGQDGSRLNNCQIDGGTHLQIRGSLQGISIQGITFIRSTRSSVVIEGLAPFDIEFYGCVWQSSRGDAALLLSSLDPESSSPSSAPTGNYSSVLDVNDDIFGAEDGDFFNSRRRASRQISVQVSFLHCSFNDNAVRSNLIASDNAAVTISSSLFSGNSIGSSVVDAERGKLELTNSCFENNDILSSCSRRGTVQDYLLHRCSIQKQ